MRLAAAIPLVALAAGGAQAMTPPCSYDPDTGRLVAPGAAGPRAEAVPFSTAPNGFVTWDVTRDAGGRTLMARSALQHCASGQEISVDYPAQRNAEIHAAWSDMVWGDTAYTMQRMVQVLNGMGARARVSRNALGDCACKTLAGLQ